MVPKNSASSAMISCAACKTEFKSDSIEITECYYCKEHFCRECIRLSVAELRIFTKRKDLHCYCRKCEERPMRSTQTENEIEERCGVYLEKVEKRIQKLENEV